MSVFQRTKYLGLSSVLKGLLFLVDACFSECFGQTSMLLGKPQCHAQMPAQLALSSKLLLQSSKVEVLSTMRGRRRKERPLMCLSGSKWSKTKHSLKLSLHVRAELLNVQGRGDSATHLGMILCAKKQAQHSFFQRVARDVDIVLKHSAVHSLSNKQS